MVTNVITAKPIQTYNQSRTRAFATTPAASRARGVNNITNTPASRKALAWALKASCQT